jgi:dihydropteroate synthase
MAVVNVTPDSFSDGGLRLDPDRAARDALRLAADGADLLDIGGESTRPGAEPVTVEEELRRVVPVLERLGAHSLGVPVSIDTSKAEVAERAIDLGATIVNDVTALDADPALAGVVARRGVAVVLMHNRGNPREMSRLATYDDVVGEVTAELDVRVRAAVSAGVPRDLLVVDPGLGFAKRAEHTFAVLAGLPRLSTLGLPLLVGPSRKSYLQAALGQLPADRRVWGTAAAVTAAVIGGAHIVRVHDVAAMCQVVRVADAIRDNLSAG